MGDKVVRKGGMLKHMTENRRSKGIVVNIVGWDMNFL
jgi:hypothetical protein